MVKYVKILSQFAAHSWTDPLIQMFWMWFHLKQWGVVQPWSLLSGSPQQNQKDALKRRTSQGLQPNWKSRPTTLSLSHRLSWTSSGALPKATFSEDFSAPPAGSEKTQRRYRLGTWNGRWRKPLEEGRACRVQAVMADTASAEFNFTHFTNQWAGPREMHKKDHIGQLAGLQMASLLVFKWPACWSSNAV